MAPELVESINALVLGAGGGASLAGVVLWFARRDYLDALAAAREHAQRLETLAGAVLTVAQDSAAATTKLAAAVKTHTDAARRLGDLVADIRTELRHDTADRP